MCEDGHLRPVQTQVSEKQQDSAHSGYRLRGEGGGEAFTGRTSVLFPHSTLYSQSAFRDILLSSGFFAGLSEPARFPGSSGETTPSK